MHVCAKVVLLIHSSFSWHEARKDGHSAYLLGSSLTVKISSVNQMKSTSLSEKRCSSWSARCKRAAWLAAVSSCARLLLRHFRDRSLWMMRLTVVREIPSSLEICRVERCDWDRSFWLWTSSSTACTFSAVRGLSLIHIWRCRRSTLCRSRWSPYH